MYLVVFLLIFILFYVCLRHRKLDQPNKGVHLRNRPRKPHCGKRISAFGGAAVYSSSSEFEEEEEGQCDDD